jgi:tetratricopeptide (TPR) repeat protein/O-antigen ligase
MVGFPNPNSNDTCGALLKGSKIKRLQFQIMPILSAIFWVLGLILSVTMAPQLRMWTWGPAMICLSASVLTAIPSYWSRKNSFSDLFIIICGFSLVAWIGIRAATSPVIELAQADGLLTAMAVATFVSFRAIANHPIANRILLIGLTLLLMASVAVIVQQVIDPLYSPIFPKHKPAHPSGFFAHYSYCASFLIPVSLILGAAALRSDKQVYLRIFLGIIAIAGCVAVFFTKSRGGFVGLGAGVLILVIVTVLAAGGKGTKKSYPLVILALPFIIMLLVAGFIFGLSQVQAARSGEKDLAWMLDNSIRYYLLGIAFSCIAMHPLFGGGSRSYSWECFQFWDTAAMGKAVAKPEHVHNELMQTVSEYGLLGAGLLLVFVLVVLITGIFQIAAKKSSTDHCKYTYWKMGGVAGFIGLFAQSNFEGILRLPTGAILLGLCLAAASLPVSRDLSKDYSIYISKSLVTVSALIASIFLAAFGWRGTQATKELWTSYFGKVRPSCETSIDALSRGIAKWPLGSLYFQRGLTYQEMASKAEDKQIVDHFIEKAVSDYITAGRLHPLDPEPAINAATLLSLAGRNKEASDLFNHAVNSQGTMEGVFHANQEYANHLLKNGLKQFAENDIQTALATLRLAVKHADDMAKIHGEPLVWPEARRLVINTHDSYGKVLEEAGDYSEALKVFDRTAELYYGNSAHYRAGVLIGSRAADAWSESRSEDALALYMKALERITMAKELPVGVTGVNRNNYISYLKKMILYLEDANFQPSENPSF